jgi:hypothetical protein
MKSDIIIKDPLVSGGRLASKSRILVISIAMKQMKYHVHD